MSFCRITGKSRGLPKPNYFPLLPPISPADAKRFCRITNKSQGLPGHHFIPALLSARGIRTHCRVTGKSEGQAPHHFPTVDGLLKQHEIIPSYKYVFPEFDEEHKLQQRILNLITSKTLPGESNARYVYSVEERSTGLVIPAGLEAAVRDGDIRDLMLDKEKDTMLVKFHQGPSVAVNVTNFVIEEGTVLWEGMGPSQAVLKQREKEEQEMEMRKKKRQEGLSNKKKIFEDKERAADEEESEIEKIKEARKSKVVKLKMRDGAEQVDVVVNSGPTPLEEHISNLNGQPVFGHIVQTATAVEFFPGDSILNLPEGKVVPGQLIRNAEGVKFVPGIMSDGRFIPGQVVKTNSGEQFVPGQVVDTRDGPKFVPGQVAETVSGPKFVPGQTIETEDGPQFVPGQIIETKAGPTFIPGQIIVTDDEPRFVPGRVVETAEGPRFVPGRVIESGNQVTFVSGQVVETSEGLKFIAPDLEDIPEGGHEFSVQGFEVTPEELKLLRPAGSCDPTSSSVFTVDSRMLRQLSEAGMSLGRQVPTKLPAVDISALPIVVEKLKLNGAQALQLSHVMTVLAQVALKVSQRSDLCASEVPLDEDAGDKILCAVKKNKDLGKYLQAIVASSVVAARSNFDEESLLSSVTSAMEAVLSTEYDNTLTKETILSVIGTILEEHHSTNGETKESLLAEISVAMENELKNQVESAVTEESALAIFNSVLDSKLGKENSIKTKGVLLEAVKSAIKKEQSVLYKEKLNKEKLLAVINATMDSGILESQSDSLSKGSLLTNILAEMAKFEGTDSEWSFSEEAIFPIINSAIENEVAAKGVTLNNGSLSSAIVTGIMTELSKKGEFHLTEEKLIACLTSVIENELPEGVAGGVTKQSLIKAVNQSIAAEKSSAAKKVLSEEKLVKIAFSALEKTVSEKGEEIPKGDEFLKKAISKIQQEVNIKRENGEIKKKLLKNLEAAVEKKITETCESVLNEEMALSAINSVIVNEIHMSLPLEKISQLIKTTFEKEKSANSNSVISKEKLLAALEQAIEHEGILKNSSAMTAFNAAVEEKRKEKYESPLTQRVITSAIDSAIEAVLSQGEEMKVNKATLMSAVAKEMEKVKATGQGTITEGRIIAAVHSAVKTELSAKGEKSSIEKVLLEAIDSSIENDCIAKSQNLLSEDEVLTTLESAIEMELSRNPNCSLKKNNLMEKINSAIAEKKLKKRETILTEAVLLECMKSAIETEVMASGENASLVDSLLSTIESAVKEERETKRHATLTEMAVIEAVSSAMDSELIQNNKISVTRGELVKLVKAAIQQGKTEEPLTEKNLIGIVQSTIEQKVANESEAHLLLKAFGSAIEKEREIARKKPIAESAFIEIVGSVIESELSPESSLKKETLLSAIVTNVNNEAIKRGDLLTEQVILSTAYSTIESEAFERGESADILLSCIDAVVESKKDSRRLVNEEIIMEAINSIADQFSPSPEGKQAVLTAVKSAMENAKALNEEPGLMHKKMLEAVSSAVADHFSNESDLTVSKDNFITAVCSAIAKEQLSNRGMLMSKELITMAVTSAVEDQLSNNPGLCSMKENLVHAANAAVASECACATEKRLTEKALLSAISSSMETVLGDLCETKNLEKVVDSMQKYLVDNLDEVIVGTVNCMVANESAMDKLKYAINHSENTMQVVEKLTSVLNDNMGEAFQKLSGRDPTLVRHVMHLIEGEKLTSKEEVTEALQRAIVDAVRQKSVETLQRLREASDGKDFKELLLQSVGLAKALGMNQMASLLLDVVSDSKSHEVLANDETVIDILQRLTIMRQFAETKPELAAALTQLISDPELAKRDPGIRELVRHSTALMTVPEEMLHSSADIPASLLASGDTLAMEQFLARARRPRTLLIVKSGMQAVVPKEAARAVLTGQVPYAVLDERGIRYFEPLHVFSTMKLPRYAAHCFSMYRCPEMEYEMESVTATPRGSFSSSEEFSKRTNGFRRYSKAVPCRRMAELGKRKGSRSSPAVYRSLSGSRITDFTRRPEFTFIRDVYY